MSQQSWTVLVDGKQQQVTADSEWQTGRSVIRINGRMASRPMMDGEEERLISVGSSRFIVRRLPDGQLDLDPAPPSEDDFQRTQNRAFEVPAESRKWPKIVGAIVVVIIAAALLRVGWRGQQYMRIDWVPYTSPDGRFSINFPAPPTQETEEMNIDGEIWKISSLTGEYKDHYYVAQFVDLRMVITSQSVGTHLEQFFGGWQSDLNAKDIRQEVTTFASQPAIEFESTVAHPDNPRILGRQRGLVTIQNKRLYFIWTMAGEGDPIVYDLDKFVESFEVRR